MEQSRAEGSVADEKTEEDEEEEGGEGDQKDKRFDVSSCLPGYTYEDIFTRRERTFPLEGRDQLRVLQRFLEIDGTAGTVWPVSEVFMREYSSMTTQSLWSARGKGVLELGSGTGVLAMFLAYHGAAGVVATDAGDGLDLLRRNMALDDNVATLGLKREKLHSALLRWDGHAEQDFEDIAGMCASGDFQLDTLAIFDTLYNQDLLEPLARILLKALAHFASVSSILVGYQDRQPEVEARGLEMIEGAFAAGGKCRITRLFDMAPLHVVVLELES